MSDGGVSSTAYRYSRTARTPRLTVALGLWAVGILIISLYFSATVWIAVVLALPLLPGLWELWRNPTAMLALDSKGLSWRSAASGSTDIPLDRIRHIRLDRRWDFSHRATVHTNSGKRLRIPPNCLPPHQRFEQALIAANLRVERHHFQIF
ncbi:hypothetical protein PhaeoP18_00896 [Phaeobacter piscinae]|uniref:Uncharacterized protein n=1 Tax=Phaeobacter piscinae TaxID=1580596 RepID=A0AAN1GPR1_9RHOB|nr:hypothetical protein [Phaeobacter piscinae]ATG42861.1 hypothetical protein PhaeoP13_00911 [Phaeobacter piscinae]AUR35179.1 hypothetical protein PhaeoP18_00896 [Phaeobacter piscinae]